MSDSDNKKSCVNNFEDNRLMASSLLQNTQKIMGKFAAWLELSMQWKLLELLSGFRASQPSTHFVWDPDRNCFKNLFGFKWNFWWINNFKNLKVPCNFHLNCGLAAHLLISLTYDFFFKENKILIFFNKISESNIVNANNRGKQVLKLFHSRCNLIFTFSSDLFVGSSNTKRINDNLRTRIMAFSREMGNTFREQTFSLSLS